MDTHTQSVSLSGQHATSQSARGAVSHCLISLLTSSPGTHRAGATEWLLTYVSEGGRRHQKAPADNPFISSAELDKGL